MAESKTPYAETELLVAVMEENWDRAEALVLDMLPGERRRLQGQLIDMASILQRGYVSDVLRGT